jgi:nucleotide-binding universal stress UspA family protein
MARRAGALLELIHVHVPLADTYAEIQVMNATLGQQMREQAQYYLSRVTHELKAETQLSVSSSFQEGPVAETIRAHVQKYAFDVVVLTTHARGAFGRFWLGSVADTLVREVKTPILLVPPAETPLPRIGPAPLRNILIPLDGTPLAEEILPAALALGRLFGSDYTLLRVLEPLRPVDPVPLGAPGSFADMARAQAREVEKVHEELRARAKTYLETLAVPLRREGLQVQTQIAMDEQPAHAILHSAGHDLIAMTTHGRRGLSRFFRGSVADKVLRGSSVPLLVQRPAKVS